MSNGLLPIAISGSVPLWIEVLKQRRWTDIQSKLPELSQVIAEKGDIILFRSKKPGESAKAFNALSEAIAALSFVPGGINIFGQHFESKHPDMES